MLTEDEKYQIERHIEAKAKELEAKAENPYVKWLWRIVAIVACGLAAYASTSCSLHATPERLDVEILTISHNK